MDPMELLKLLGIVIVVVGFACKLDSILVIMVAAVATALVAGMDPVSFLETMGVFRVVFAAFNVGFGGVAGFVRPVVMPMAQAAVESDGKKIAPEQLENIKGMAAGMENITWFFGQMLFVGGAGALLVQNTLEPLGYHVELIGLASVAVAPAIIATIAAIVYYQVLDRKDTKRYHSEQLSMDGDK